MFREAARAIRCLLSPGIGGVRAALAIARLGPSGVARYGSRFFATIPRAIRLLRDEGYTLAEAHEIGLLDPGRSSAHLKSYASKETVLRVQQRLNPTRWAQLFRDKGVFYRYCGAAGIPVPALYAILFRTTAGWTYTGQLLRSPEDWVRFLERDVPEEFVVKPAAGTRGRGVRLYRRRNGAFHDQFDRTYTALSLYGGLCADADDDCFVIQERLRNDPALASLSATSHLQTVRLVTFLDADGACQILLAVLKVIVGPNVTDNFDYGTTGNLFAEVSLADGTLGPAVGRSAADGPLTTFVAHPTTGLAFAEFQLPRWDEVRSLVTAAARQFAPVRTIGWDVALTPRGPVVVEGNIWWDPPPLPSVKALLSVLNAQA